MISGKKKKGTGRERSESATASATPAATGFASGSGTGPETGPGQVAGCGSDERRSPAPRDDDAPFRGDRRRGRRRRPPGKTPPTKARARCWYRPTTNGSSRATTQPTTRRSPPAAATSSWKPWRATSSPMTTPTPRPVQEGRGLPLRPADAGARESRRRQHLRRRSNEFVRIGASRPSISADGRFVAFLTAQRLLAADVNENLDAYVRDMDVPIGASGAFDLVSAADGGDAPALYGPRRSRSGQRTGGRDNPGTAISADGSRVAFMTEAPSNLPSGGAVDVPAGQVYLRDRVTDTTTLVTAKRDPGTGEMTSQPAGGALGASLSPDGTTVAWTGGNASTQTRFLGGENTDSIYLYYLWRRPADGPQRRPGGSPGPPTRTTRRACAAARTSTGSRPGPATDRSTNGGPSRRHLLSGTGAQRRRPHGGLSDRRRRQTPAQRQPGPRPVRHRHEPGVTRKQGTVELTRDTLDNNTATAQPVSSVSISPDGRYLLITCARTKFAFPALKQLGDPRPVPGPREAYVVDLEARTLERVVHSFSGADSDAGVTEGANVSADGNVVAFASLPATSSTGLKQPGRRVRRRPGPGPGRAPPTRALTKAAPPGRSNSTATARGSSPGRSP